MLLAAASSHATLSTETFLLGTTANGTSPAGTPPWITAVLSETSTPGTLNLKLSAPNLSSGEFMSSFFLNYSPGTGSSSLAGLTFTPVDVSAVGSVTYLHSANNSVPTANTQTFGKYDIQLKFPTAATGNRFTDNESITIAIGNAQLADFNYFSQTKQGVTLTHMVGADIQGIRDDKSGQIVADGYTSGIVPVPEASTWLAGAGALGLVLVGTGARSRKLAASQIN